MNVIKLLRQKWNGTMEFKKQHGWKKTIIVIKRTLLKQPVNDLFIIPTLPNVPMICTSGVQQLLDIQFRYLQSIPYIRIQDDVNRLNLVLDSMEINTLLEGKMEALIIATEYAKQNEMTLRIITRNASANPSNYRKLLAWFGMENYTNIEFYSDYDRDVNGDIQYKLEISAKDVFMVTSWQSALVLKEMPIDNRVYFLITDASSVKNETGINEFLCEQVTQSDDIRFIVSSSSLYNYIMKNIEFKAGSAIYYNPIIFSDLILTDKEQDDDRKSLVFYSDVSKDEEMFYYGLQVLDYAVRTGVINKEEWKIYYTSHNISNITFDNGYEAQRIEVNSLEEYEKFLNQADVSLVLNATPHFSRVVYDLSAHNTVVLTNAYKNKTEFEEGNNVIVSNLNKNELAKNLGRALKLAKNIKKKKDNYDKKEIKQLRDKELKKIMAFMQERENV